MICYDEQGNPIESPDLTAGYVYPHHKADGTVVSIYHAWTEAELAEMEAGREKKSEADRIAELEEALELLLSGATETEAAEDG